MHTGIWKVDMALRGSLRRTSHKYNVEAKSMAEAIEKAEKLEQAWVFEPDDRAVPVAVQYICDLHVLQIAPAGKEK